MFIPDPRSRIRLFPSRILIFPSQIRIKEFKYYNPKKLYLSFRKYDPGCSSRIRILTFYPSGIPDPGGQKGTGSRILRNTGRTVLSYAAPLFKQKNYIGRSGSALWSEAGFEFALKSKFRVNFLLRSGTIFLLC